MFVLYLGLLGLLVFILGVGILGSVAEEASVQGEC